MDWSKIVESPALVWFLIGLVLLVGELITPGLIIFFFGIGAWVTALVCLFANISLNLQLLIFLITSVASLLCLRKFLTGIFKGHIGSKQDMQVNLEEFAGKRVVVKKKITPKLPGKVELNGVDWEAAADTEINEGEVVEIVGKDDLTLKVKNI